MIKKMRVTEVKNQVLAEPSHACPGERMSHSEPSPGGRNSPLPGDG